MLSFVFKAGEVDKGRNLGAMGLRETYARRKTSGQHYIETYIRSRGYGYRETEL